VLLVEVGLGDLHRQAVSEEVHVGQQEQATVARVVLQALPS